MGIPSYFSHIIRNYKQIINNLAYFKNGESLNNLFLDSNSIVYDAIHSFTVDTNELKSDDFENLLIDKVIEKIKFYIELVKPNKSIYIAFDGVAPFAKMEQQRTRRYKTSYMSKLNFATEKKIQWDTSSITPGTPFMNHLSNRIQYAFKHQELKYGVNKIIVSGSNEAGEGEHKITEFMRTFGDKSETVALYGLDADLIMLSMFVMWSVVLPPCFSVSSISFFTSSCISFAILSNT
jgi:5'-3' exoribonuclease 1